MTIASKARKLMALDDFTTRYRKMGFTMIRVELDVVDPLKLGVSIRGLDGIFLATFCL